MKVASFTVHATAEQSRLWKMASEGEGFLAVGAWAANALDAYLKIRARAGQPVPLAWRRGRFKATLSSGQTIEVRGRLSPPFGSFCGSESGPASYSGRHLNSLVYVPTSRVLATFRTHAQVKLLASELARIWYRGGDGSEPSGDPRPVLARTTPT